MEKFSLKGKRALITGGSRGIGFGYAKAFAECGSHLVLVARTDDTLKKAKNAINFHPAPPKYPGSGCYNFAIYNKDKKIGMRNNNAFFFLVMFELSNGEEAAEVFDIICGWIEVSFI